MAKVWGPLHSQAASGKYSDNLIFKTYEDKVIVTQNNPPGSVKPFEKSEEQSAVRTTFENGKDEWNSLSEAEQQTYKDKADGQPYTGFNLFMSNYLKEHLITEETSIYGLKTYGKAVYGET